MGEEGKEPWGQDPSHVMRMRIFKIDCATGGVVDQLDRSLPCHGKGCGFDPRPPRQLYQYQVIFWIFVCEGLEESINKL